MGGLRKFWKQLKEIPLVDLPQNLVEAVRTTPYWVQIENTPWGFFYHRFGPDMIALPEGVVLVNTRMIEAPSSWRANKEFLILKGACPTGVILRRRGSEIGIFTGNVRADIYQLPYLTVIPTDDTSYLADKQKLLLPHNWTSVCYKKLGIPEDFRKAVISKMERVSARIVNELYTWASEEEFVELVKVAKEWYRDYLPDLIETARECGYTQPLVELM